VHNIQQEEDDDGEENTDENGEKKGEEEGSKKSMTYIQRKTLKKMKTKDYSMNSINVGNIKEEDMLTYLKMRKLKNLFNVCKDGTSGVTNKHTAKS
jgi:hypothetical protein